MIQCFHFQVSNKEVEPNGWVKIFRKHWIYKHNQECHKNERKRLIIRGHKTKRLGQKNFTKLIHMIQQLT